eukprot:Gb_13179 [translate_table: standard]
MDLQTLTAPCGIFPKCEHQITPQYPYQTSPYDQKHLSNDQNLW